MLHSETNMCNAKFQQLYLFLCSPDKHSSSALNLWLVFSGFNHAPIVNCLLDFLSHTVCVMFVGTISFPSTVWRHYIEKSNFLPAVLSLSIWRKRALLRPAFNDTATEPTHALLDRGHKQSILSL